MPDGVSRRGNFARISDTEFDESILVAVSAVKRTLSTGRYDSYCTTVFLIHPSKIEVHGVNGIVGDGHDIYTQLYDFGKQLARMKPLPQSAFVAVQSTWEDETECVFISGSTPDGRQNGYRLTIERSGTGMIELSAAHPLFYREGHVFEGLTYAGELMRGFLERGEPEN